MDEELRGTEELGAEPDVQNEEQGFEEPEIYYEPESIGEETVENKNVAEIEKTVDSENEVSQVKEQPEMGAVTSSGEDAVTTETVGAYEQPPVGRQDVWRHEPDSPYSPLYVPDRKQVNNNKLTITCVILLIIALIVCLVFAMAKVVDTVMDEASDDVSTWKEAYQEFVENFEEEAKDAEEYADNRDDWNNWGDWGNIPEPDEDAWPDDFNWEEYEEYNEYEDYDDYSEYEEYVPNADDEYYVEFVDSIRDDLSYSVDKEEYLYNDDNSSVNIYVEYAVVDGENLAFVDQINAKLEESAMFYAREFASDDITDFILYVESYVTYMDENILSVVIDEQCSWGYEGTVDLYCLNFDMKTGVLLNNTDIIDATEELAEEFRDMSEYQNDYIEYLDELSDEEICEYLSDEDYLIVFYTPVGLEVGLNYYDGWVTATIKDYEKYLKRL